MSHSPTTYPSTQAAEQDGASRAFVLFTIAFITLVFFLPIKRSWTMSVDENWTHVFVNYGVEEDEAWARPLAVLMLFGFGVTTICWPGGKRMQLDTLLGVLWIGFLVWCGLSCFWGDDTRFALTRFAGDLCAALAAFGLARRVSPHQFVWILFGCTASWLGLSLLAEVSQGTFRPWDSEHRFAGLFHPNGMGTVCALIVLSSLYLARQEPAYRRYLLMVAGVAVICLYFTRSRTALAALLAVVGLGWMVVAPKRKVLLGASLVAILAASAGLLLGDVSSTADGAISLGREESHAGSLTNRLPLWQELMPYIGARPFGGYSYCFWMEERDFIEPAQSAHSLYVDTLLAFGLVGGLFYFLGFLLAIGRSTRLSFTWQGYGFFALLFVMFLVTGFSETTLGFTQSMGFFVLAALCYPTFHEEPRVEHVEELRWDQVPQSLMPSWRYETISRLN